jgi:dephospho-CoA kinase
MQKIGITGGIGSGKTTVCLLFKKLYQVPIYFADDRAKIIVEENSKVKEKIIELLGVDAYQNNQYNRKYIASKVFENKTLLQKINAIIHPAVFEDANNFFLKHKNEKYVLYEAAILFESGSYKLMDKIILVTAPTEIRVERTMKRDHIGKADVLKRINHQLPDQEKIKNADFVILNDGNKDLESQIITIHQEILNSTK